jgi:hypothetical protein
MSQYKEKYAVKISSSKAFGGIAIAFIVCIFMSTCIADFKWSLFLLLYQRIRYGKNYQEKLRAEALEKRRRMRLRKLKEAQEKEEEKKRRAASTVPRTVNSAVSCASDFSLGLLVNKKNIVAPMAASDDVAGATNMNQSACKLIENVFSITKKEQLPEIKQDENSLTAETSASSSKSRTPATLIENINNILKQIRMNVPLVDKSNDQEQQNLMVPEKSSFSSSASLIGNVNMLFNGINMTELTPSTSKDNTEILPTKVENKTEFSLPKPQTSVMNSSDAKETETGSSTLVEDNISTIMKGINIIAMANTNLKQEESKPSPEIERKERKQSKATNYRKRNKKKSVSKISGYNRFFKRH